MHVNNLLSYILVLLWVPRNNCITYYISTSITPESYTINQITKYTWVINRNINALTGQFLTPTTLPADAYVQLKFPTSYVATSATSLSCSNNVVSSIVCGINNRVLTVTGLFSTGNRATDSITVVVDGIKNPSRAAPSANFEIYIKSSSGTIIQQSPSATSADYSTSITFSPSSFTSCSISANSNFISTRSRLTFTIRTQNAIPSDGQLVIEIPSTWDYDLSQSITVASTPTCTPVSGLGVTTCSYSVQSSPINIVRVSVSSLSIAGISDGSTLVLDVSSILTPPYTNYIGTISMYSKWADGIQIDTCTSRITNTIPIPFRSIVSTITAGTSQVQSKFTQKLSLTLSKPLSSSDEITLLLPNNYLTNNQIDIKLSNYNTFATTIQQSAANTKQTQVRLSNFPSNSPTIAQGNVFNIFFNDVYNFQSIEPQNIVITFYRQLESYQLSTFSYVATIGSFNSVEVVGDSMVVGTVGPGTIKLNSQYKISTGAILQVQYNSAITAAQLASTPVISASLSGNSTANVRYSISQNIIKIQNLFQSSYNGGIIEVKIGQLTNPPTVRPTPYTITILSSTNYAIASSSYTFTPSLQVFKSVSATLTASSYKVLDTSVTYTLAFETFYGFKSVSIIVPGDVKVESGFETTCSPSTFASCQIQQVGTGWVRNITFIGTMSAGLQRISWGSNVNPSSLKTTASFNLYTYDNGWGVQRSSGIISLTMTELNTLLSVQALPSSYLNDALISLQISYILPGLTPTGTLILTLPSVLDLTSSSCSLSSSCTIIPPRIRISFTNTNTNRDTSITYSNTITISNIRNAPSLKPIDNIAIVYTSSQNYDSLSYSASAWTNTLLSSFVTTVGSDMGYRGENGLFSFGITGLSGKQMFVNIRVNPNFRALTTAPTSATLVSAYQVRYSIPGEGTSQISFTLQTPTAIGQYTFTLRTYTSDGYLMGQSTSNIWRHSCYGSQCRACNGALCLNCYNSSLSLYYMFNTADSTCIPGCNAGQYKNSSTNSCIPCNTNCKQCSTSPTTCTVCNTTPTLYYLNTITSTCVIDCPVDYYKNTANGKCTACVSPCYTCLNDNVCVSCIAGYYLLGTTYECVAACPALKMVNNNVNRTCDYCTTNCLTCQNFTYTCLTCNNSLGLYLQSASCVTGCSPQKFLVNNICTQCQPPCRVCHNSTTTCSSCLTSSSTPLWYNFGCITSAECVIGHFVNAVNFSCDACPGQCLVCISLTNCSSCALGFYLYANKCISACPNITYKKDSTRTCQLCVGCVTCASLTVCTSCKGVEYLYQQACYALCPSGTYPSTQAVTTGTRAICIACASNCLTCLNSTYCLSCQSQITQQNLYKGICYQTCPTQTYPSPPVCQDCPTTCLTCQSSQTCLTCVQPYSLQNSKCVLNCQVGVSDNQVCLPCGYNCSICNVTVAQCQICVNGYSLYNHACVASCPVRMFSSGKECLNCVDTFVNCSTCNANQCFTCLEGQLKNGSCFPCTTGYYTMNSKCVLCPSQCTICRNPTFCSSCSPGYYLQADFCVSVCPSNKMPNGTKCDVCIQNCQKCNLQIPGSCTLCVAGMLMFQGYCVSVCPEPYVRNLNTTLCISQQAYSLQYSKASKSIYFPFSIAMLAIIIIGIVLKVYVKDMHIITFLVAVGAWVQLASWVLFGVIQYMFYTNLQTNAVIGILLVLAALGALLLANLVFLRLYCKYFGDDMDFVKWEAKHYCINKVFVVFGGCISFKVHRMLYSKVMDRDQLSLVLSSPKKLIPISILSVISILLSSGSIIVACSLAIYNSLGQDQQFFNALDTLVITGIMTVLMLMDLKHGHNYFIDEHQTKNIKNKMFLQDYQEFSMNGNKNNKNGDKYKVEEFQRASDMSREGLVQGAGDNGGIMDNMVTAKKFRVNKNNQKLGQGQFNETMRETSQTGTKLKQISNSELQQINSMNLLAPPQNQHQYLDQPQQQAQSQPKWIQKQYDAHGYLVKRDALNNAIKYDDNGYRVEIDQNGKHHKYDQDGYQMLYNKEKGVYQRYDKEGYRVGQDGNRYDERGYRVQKMDNGQVKYYDENGYQVVKDQNGQQIKIDQHGNQVKLDTETGTYKPYNKDGHEIIYGKDGKQNQYKNKQGQYVRYNPLTKQWQEYDPEDNFTLKKNPNTGQYEKYDQHGFRVEKDQYGKLYRYDENNNRVIIDSNGNIHRYNKQGYQIVKDSKGQQKLYDKDGYQVRIDPQTGNKTFYDKHGYRVQRDFYGKVTLYDKQGNMVIIDPVSRKHRKFNKQGLQIIDDGNGNVYLKDKRGRKVVQLQDGYYEKYDEEGNKVWLDQQGYEVQTDKDGNITKYDKVGDVVQEDEEQQDKIQDNGQWQIDEERGDNAASPKKAQKKQRIKFKQTKQYNFQQQYSKMLQQNKPNLLNFEQQQSIDDNLKQFHDVQPVPQYQLQKQYQTLYNMETQNQWMRRDRSDNNLNIKLEDLDDVDNTPYTNLKEKNRRKNMSGNIGDHGGEFGNDNRNIQPEIEQDKLEVKSVADASIDERSFDNEGVQPITQQSVDKNDDLDSIQQIDVNRKMKKQKKRRSQANLQQNNISKAQNRSQNNYMINKSQLQKQQARKIYDSDDQVQSLEQQQWQNQPPTDIFYKDNPNTNTRAGSQDKAADLQQQSDILSDYIPQHQDSERNHKASQENILHKKYMQSIEEVEDQLFDKLRSQDNRKVKRTDFKLSGTPNPLVEYAKTIDVKKMQEQRNRRKDRYADTNKNNVSRR